VRTPAKPTTMPRSMKAGSSFHSEHLLGWKNTAIDPGTGAHLRRLTGLSPWQVIARTGPWFIHAVNAVSVPRPGPQCMECCQNTRMSTIRWASRKPVPGGLIAFANGCFPGQPRPPGRCRQSVAGRKNTIRQQSQIKTQSLHPAIIRHLWANNITSVWQHPSDFI